MNTQSIDNQKIQRAMSDMYALTFDPRYTGVFSKIYADVYNALNLVEKDLSQYGRIGDMNIGSREDAEARVMAVSGIFENFRGDLVERFATCSTVEEPAENFLQTGSSLGSEESVYPTEEENVSYASSVDAQGIDFQTSDIYDTSELLESSECYDVEFPQSFEDDVFGTSEV